MRPGGTPPVARISAGAAVAALVTALVVLPLLRLAQVVWQEGAGNLPRLLGSGGMGEAGRNTVVLAVAGAAAGGSGRGAPGGGLAGAPPPRAGLPAGGPRRPGRLP